MHRPARCTVVYVNFGTTDLLLASLASLGEQQASLDVVVVDNATPGFTPELVTDLHPGVRVVEAGSNLGFGRGNNLGAQGATTDYLWILNTDTLADGTDLDALLDHLDAHPQLAAVLPLVVDGEGRAQRAQVGRFPTPARVLVEAVAQTLPVALSRHRVDLPVDLPQDQDVAWATAAALVVRRSAFEAVGGFSDDFFFYLEDVDLCRRLGRVRWLPSVTAVTHLGGRSIQDDAVRRARYQEGLQTYTRRWHGRAATALVRGLGAVAVRRASISATPGGQTPPAG